MVDFSRIPCILAIGCWEKRGSWAGVVDVARAGGRTRCAEPLAATDCGDTYPLVDDAIGMHARIKINPKEIAVRVLSKVGRKEV